MKIISTLLLALTWASTFSQTSKIKIKKTIGQDQMSSVATIGGYYYGKCPVSNIIADKQIKISNNKTGLKIVSFEAAFLNNGGLKSFNCSADTLPQEIINSITTISSQKNRNFYIENIKAISPQKDTLVLNPIILRLTN